MPAACADRGGGRRGRALAWLESGAGAVTEESEHTAGRNGTGCVPSAAACSLLFLSPHSLSLSIPSPSRIGRSIGGRRRPRNDDRRARPPHRPAGDRLAISVSTSLMLLQQYIIVCCAPRRGNSRSSSREANWAFRRVSISGAVRTYGGAAGSGPFGARVCTFLHGFQELLLCDLHLFQWITAVLGR